MDVVREQLTIEKVRVVKVLEDQHKAVVARLERELDTWLAARRDIACSSDRKITLFLSHTGSRDAAGGNTMPRWTAS
jgi:hypothetical protein